MKQILLLLLFGTLIQSCTKEKGEEKGDIKHPYSIDFYCMNKDTVNLFPSYNLSDFTPNKYSMPIYFTTSNGVKKEVFYGVSRSQTDTNFAGYIFSLQLRDDVVREELLSNGDSTIQWVITYSIPEDGRQYQNDTIVVKNPWGIWNNAPYGNRNDQSRIYNGDTVTKNYERNKSGFFIPRF